MVSGIPVVLGPGTKMWDPDVHVDFWPRESPVPLLQRPALLADKATDPVPKGPSTKYLKSMVPKNHTNHGLWDQGPEILDSRTL